MEVQEFARRTGWIVFVAVMLVSVGTLKVISALSYFADSHRVNDLSAGLFGDQLWAWGLWDLAIAALAFFGAWSLVNGGEFGRIVGYLFGIVLIVENLLIIQYAPWYAAFAIAIGILVVYALASTPTSDLREV